MRSSIHSMEQYYRPICSLTQRPINNTTRWSRIYFYFSRNYESLKQCTQHVEMNCINQSSSTSHKTMLRACNLKLAFYIWRKWIDTWMKEPSRNIGAPRNTSYIRGQTFQSWFLWKRTVTLCVYGKGPTWTWAGCNKRIPRCVLSK